MALDPEMQAISERIQQMWNERMREYNLDYYHTHKDGKREARREYYKRWRAKQTNESRAAFLARQRELAKKRRARKKEEKKRQEKQ